MYVAKQDFNSYAQGKKKKGDEVEYNETLLNSGLIEEAGTKPAQKVKLETKPEPKKAKKNK